MGYLSKSLLKKAYITLSNLTEDHRQGQTQIVSALRYIVALDMFYKSKKRNCNLNLSEDRNDFTSNVRFVVNINNDNYTANFYTTIESIEDCRVGSNFYSAGVVAKSKVNSATTFDYPTRGSYPLFQVKNNTLYIEKSYYPNIRNYLPNDIFKSAFAIWLLRNEFLEELSFNEIRKNLFVIISKELTDELIPDQNIFDKFIEDYALEDKQPMITPDDFLHMLPRSTDSKSITVSPTGAIKFTNPLHEGKYIPYRTALKTKPFMLLAGISGTGKSRIVREMAKACWKEGDPEYGKNHPKNYCMVQVKPNWHDSTELMGYVTRISGKPEYVAGDFIKFVVKAWYNEDTPFFLCLDEMNLAPVEQYFAEYLSVIESRKMNSDGIIATDPILKASYHRKDDGTREPDEWFVKLIDNLLVECPDEKLFAIRKQFLEEGIAIPQNFFVVGTVNMDETTFSFSRKVLDRAMTIEMNEVDLHGGLEKDTENEIGYIGNSIIGDAAEGKDVYADNKELCDQVLEYLEQVNAILKDTPFKIAYRTRNEFLMYAVNRRELDKESQLWQSLDEMTSMKILSRIEGDSDRTKSALEGLQKLVKEQIEDHIPPAEEGKPQHKSISAAKITEMLNKLNDPGFTSYWS